MQTVVLGRTGLTVGVVGLGCGGHSRLGMANGADEAQASRVVAAALDLGIDFIDTARAYGTESAVARAIRGRRDGVVLSTKALPAGANGLMSAAELRESLDLSLTRLGTDYVDVFHLHGVLTDQYVHCLDVLLPELVRAREAGKVRFIGITERFGTDTDHAMLKRALPDDHFDVVMVGHNLLNPSARQSVFPLTRANDVGTLIMFAVRRALTNRERVGAVVGQLIDSGAIDAHAVDRADPLGFVASHRGVNSLIEAAYRFCRYEPGAHVILTGTGSVEHLRENVDAILAPPLPAELTAKLAQMFGNVDSVSGD
ncbi:MAG TPA: aldo/keto reductase [Pseudomonadales bacterium]|jgi:aryl-alcohol dehydrogenase-like predicted oxidoreductase|nr:aldo/keto reductase [Pseudomonadales bacterium]